MIINALLKYTNTFIRLRILFVFTLILFCTHIFSQFTGQVVDSETGTPIEGASIIKLENDSLIGFSNIDGYFYLKANAFDQLNIQSLGYQSLQIIVVPELSEKTIRLSPSPFSLNEVNVNASLLNGSIAKSSAAIHRISRKEIRTGKAVSAPEFLNALPGVMMQQGTYSTNKLMIRGIGSRESYGTNRIKVYFDEIPLTNGDGFTTFEDIDPLFISRMEVLKGSSSALYGSGLGGTLRIYSETPNKEGAHGVVESLVGSYGLFKNNLSFYNSDQKSDITALFSNTFSKGYRQNNKYVRNNALLKSHIKLKQAKLTFLFQYVGINSQIPSSLGITTFENNPSAAAGNWLAINGYEKYDKLLGGITYETKITTSLRNFTTVFGNIFNGYELRPFNVLDNESTMFGVRERLLWTKNKFTISGGFEILSEKYKWQLFETSEGAQGKLFSDNKENRYYLNTFLLGGWNISEHLKMDAGLNLNIFGYKVTDYFNTEETENLSGTFKNPPIISPRLGLVYNYTSTHSLYLSAAHGFSTPSVEEALLPEGNINPDLKSEEGVTLEGGIRGNLKWINLEYDVDVYRTNVQNMLVTKRLSEEDFMSINAGKVYHQGLEISATKLLFLNPDLTLFLKGTYSYSVHRFIDYMDDNQDFSGNELPGVPNQQTFLGLNGIIFKKYSLHLNYNFIDSQFLNDANTGKYPSYQTINFKTGYGHKWNNLAQLKINVGIDNVFNKHYASMLLINAPKFGNSEPRYYYPALPRNFYVSISFSK